MRLSLVLISLTAPRAAAFQSPQTPRPALQLHSTPPDDGTFGSDGPMMAADPDAELWIPRLSSQALQGTSDITSLPQMQQAIASSTAALLQVS